jgi:HEAT repeats
MLRQSCIFVVAVCSAALASGLALAAPPEDVLSRIERAASSQKEVPSSFYESLTEDIEKNPAEVSKRLLSKLQDKNLTERQLTIYVWALGVTKDPTAVDAIVKLYQRVDVPMVKQNCLHALMEIGGKDAGDHLLSALKSATDKEMRFGILNCLAQMQCEAALPKTEEVLRQDPAEFYWQCYFVFGKMGDKAIPFLLKRIADDNRNIRTNATCILGMWLLAPEAAKPLQDRFWKETDVKLRCFILNSLPALIVDPAELRSFCEKVAAKEKDKDLATIARRVIDGMDEMKAGIASAAKTKHVSKDSFQQEYTKLFKSCGKKGDYKILSSASTVKDEPALKALRERILQRDSDESFYDYQKVSGIIVQNRMIAGSQAGDK